MNNFEYRRFKKTCKEMIFCVNNAGRANFNRCLCAVNYLIHCTYIVNPDETACTGCYMQEFSKEPHGGTFVCKRSFLQHLQ